MEQGPNAKNIPSFHSTTASKWLPERAVLKLLNISKTTLQSWYKEAGLPKYQIKRVTFYKESDLDKLLQRHRIVAGKNTPTPKQPVHGKVSK